MLGELLKSTMATWETAVFVSRLCGAWAKALRQRRGPFYFIFFGFANLGDKKNPLAPYGHRFARCQMQRGVDGWAEPCTLVPALRYTASAPVGSQVGLLEAEARAALFVPALRFAFQQAIAIA